MKNILPLINFFLVFQATVLPWKLSHEESDELNIGIEQTNEDIQTEDEEAGDLEFLIEDINKAESITKEYIDEDNIIHTVQIETNPASDTPSSNISLTRLANKTYTIRYTKDASVSSSFKIDILSNKIQRAHSSSVTLYKGTLSDSKLVRISSTKAQQTFNQKLLFGTRKYSVTATVSNGKIVVHAIP
jgi:hypothetical protein